MNNWLVNKLLPSLSKSRYTSKSTSVPDGVWSKCKHCEAVLYRPELEKHFHVCPKCDYHMRIGAQKRLTYFLDQDTSEELFAGVEPYDILKFKDSKRYKERLHQAQRQTEMQDALLVKKGTLHTQPVVVCAFEFGFMGGSMGSVVGEKFTRAVLYCIEEKLPFICFSASGGARMQEALFSLMQMAKTSAALQRLKTHALPFISIMTDPVYGGVSASLAMLGDINIAEPGALIGFAGPRVIEQTVREKLPEGFQRSEFLLDHGALDLIVHRKQLRDTVSRLCKKLMHLPN